MEDYTKTKMMFVERWIFLVALVRNLTVWIVAKVMGDRDAMVEEDLDGFKAWSCSVIKAHKRDNKRDKAGKA